MPEYEVKELKKENAMQNENLKQLNWKVDTLYGVVDNVKEKLYSWVWEIKDMIFHIEKWFEEQKNRFEKSKNCKVSWYNFSIRNISRNEAGRKGVVFWLFRIRWTIFNGNSDFQLIR